MINVNRRFDLRETMALALESDLRTVIGDVARGHGYERLKEEQLSAIEKFVSGQDVFVSLSTGFGKSLIYGLPPTTVNGGSLHDLRPLATASIAKHTQRCTYVLLEQQACCVRSPTTCYNITSGCKALWGEPDKAPFVSI